jgi:hypothetical protein
MIHGNTVISHFGDVDRKCTFCKIGERERLKREFGRELTQAEEDNIQVVDENRPHIFWDCTTVKDCVRDVHTHYWGRDVVLNKKDYLLGINMQTVEATVLYMLINMFIKYRIWKYKLAGVLPRPRCISNDLNEWMRKLCAFRKWKNMLPLVRQHIVQN